MSQRSGQGWRLTVVEVTPVRRLLASMVLGLSLVACTTSSQPPQPPPPITAPPSVTPPMPVTPPTPQPKEQPIAGAADVMAVHLDGKGEERLGPAPANVQWASLGPDGQTVMGAHWAKDGEVWRTRSFLANQAGVIAVPADLYTRQWVDSNRLIAMTEARKTYIWNRVSGERKEIDLAWEFKVSPDGLWVAGLVEGEQPGTQSIAITNISSGDAYTILARVHRYTPGKEGDWSLHLVWSPDSNAVAVLDGEKGLSPELAKFSLARGMRDTLLPQIQGISAWGAQLAWSPDGARMAVRNKLFDLQTQKAIDLGDPMYSYQFYWDPTGRYLAYQNQYDPWSAVSIFDVTTGKSTQVGKGALTGWTKDGRVVLIRWAASDSAYIPPGV